MRPRQLPDAEAMLAITEHRLTIDDQPGPADMLAFQSGAPHASAHSFDDQVAFELSDGAKDDDTVFSPRGPVVSMLSRYANQFDVEVAQFIDHLQEVTHGTG